MAYVHGSAAEQFGAARVPQREPREGQAPRRLTVVPGTRQAAPADLLLPLASTALRSARAVAFLAAALFVVALMLTGVTRLVLEQDRTVQSQITDAQAQARQLEVQVAANEDSSRIIEYSTQVYGMVPASQVATVDLTDATQGDAGSAE